MSRLLPGSVMASLTESASDSDSDSSDSYLAVETSCQDLLLKPCCVVRTTTRLLDSRYLTKTSKRKAEDRLDSRMTIWCISFAQRAVKLKSHEESACVQTC